MAGLVFFPYVGGKSFISHWLSQYVPEGGSPYCEPFAGSAGLFFKRARAPIEVLNDLDEVLINAYRVVQSDDYDKLHHMMKYTLYSRAETERAAKLIGAFRSGKDVDSVELAWAKIVIHRLSIGGMEVKSGSNWGRVLGMRPKPLEFFSFKRKLDQVRKRLAGVHIENASGIECILKWDNLDAVFYVDPPYLMETRRNRKQYHHEMNDADHKQLIDVLLSCKGAVTLSGYPNSLYRVLEEHGWALFMKTTICFSAGRVRGTKLRGKGAAKKMVPRVECVWVNPRAQNMLIQQGKLSALFTPQASAMRLSPRAQSAA